MARILVVEDSPTQAQSLQILLEDAGFQVDLAPDGAVALERLESSIPDLVLSDVVMPELGGHELCRRIRADPRLREIPVILLTSQDDSYEILAALESGADNFLVKPCAPDRLLRRVSAVLDGRRLRAEGQVEGSAEVLFRGRRFRIDSDRERVLDLLVTTLGDVVDREQELAASEARLVEANRELEAFSYSVAHDLGAHLRGIDGFSRLVLQEGATAGLSDTLRSWLGRVTSAADRMRNLIDDLMRLSGVVRGELDRRPVDLADRKSVV